MEYQIRPEGPEDYREVERLTRAAFSEMHHGKPDEHLLAHRMRDIPAFVPELDLVAEQDGKILGNILYAKSKIIGPDGSEHETLTFGPLSVWPELQGKGIGGALVRRSLEDAAKLGHRAVFIFGHPGYYPRFGFENAEKFGVTTADGKNFDAFMGLELYPGALEGVSGKLVYDPVYDDLSPEDVAEFDREF